MAYLRDVDGGIQPQPCACEDPPGEDFLHSLSALALVELLEKGTDLNYMAAFTRLSELDPALAFDAALRSGRERRLDYVQNMVCGAWARSDAPLP